MNKKRSRRSPRRAARERTPFEWVLLLLAALAIGMVLTGLILYASATAGGIPAPRASVELTGREVDGGLETLVTLENKAGAGAEDVVVEVEMGGESREVTFIRIAKDEQKTAAVYFPAGTTGAPKASVLSYNHP